MDPAAEASSPAPTPAKRERILEAAAAVFLEKGYHVATIDEIAERAGVGKGTIYLYFPSKAALVEALLQSTVRTHLEAVRRRLSEVEGTIAQLYALAEFDIAYIKEEQDLAHILTSGDALGLTPEFRERMYEILNDVKVLIAELIRRGQAEGTIRASLDPEIVASTIMGMRFGILHECYHPSRGRPPEEVYRVALEILLHGIQSEGNPPNAG